MDRLFPYYVTSGGTFVDAIHQSIRNGLLFALTAAPVLGLVKVLF